MYSSTIEPNTYGNGKFGGKLEMMGRLIKEEPDGRQPIRSGFNNFAPPPERTPTPAFFLGNNQQAKNRLFSSVINPVGEEQDQLNRFPSFNLPTLPPSVNQSPPLSQQPQQPTQFGTRPQFEAPANETAEEKRKREILAIKQQL